MSGTPEGISNVMPGDEVHARLLSSDRKTLIAEIKQRVVRWDDHTTI